MTSIKLIGLILISILIQNCNSTTKPELGYKMTPPTEEEMYQGTLEYDRIQNKFKELNIVKDYSDGLRKAREENKSTILIFTGHAVINSSRLEHEVIAGNEEVFNLMKDDFVNVWLYVDSKEKLQETDPDYGKYNTLGEKWSALQKNKYKGAFQPHIFILNTKGEIIKGGLGFSDVKIGFSSILKESKIKN